MVSEYNDNGKLISVQLHECEKNDVIGTEKSENVVVYFWSDLTQMIPLNLPINV